MQHTDPSGNEKVFAIILLVLLATLKSSSRFWLTFCSNTTKYDQIHKCYAQILGCEVYRAVREKPTMNYNKPTSQSRNPFLQIQARPHRWGIKHRYHYDGVIAIGAWQQTQTAPMTQQQCTLSCDQCTVYHNTNHLALMMHFVTTGSSEYHKINQWLLCIATQQHCYNGTSTS